MPFSELIPSYAGQGGHRKHVQRRTLLGWIAMASVGLACFGLGSKASLSTQARAAALSLLFPGAGYIASANVLAFVLLAVTYLLLPICLLLWFGAGGLAFPFLLWSSSVAGAYLTTGSDGLFEGAGATASVLLAAFLLFFNRFSARARARADAKREQRNNRLPSALETITNIAVQPPSDDYRELSLSDLRRLQWLFDVGHQSPDDWSNFVIIDQFQTSALRYQLYEMMYCLGIYQGIYTPNFHGYCSEVFRATIDRSLTPRVMGFWKWESLWGKFTSNYDPIIEDNIMVSGWLLQGLALYIGNTGDMRYTQPGSLAFQVGKNNVYRYDIHSISRALVAQWQKSPYTLFPCEPNWIYSPCNLQGIVGQIMYDRVFKTQHASDLRERLEHALTTEFMEPDGSIIPIRSELTGFTIPGLCGALGDLANAMMCRGHLDHIARRVWAIFREENIRNSEKDGLSLTGLVGADLIDPGTYKSSPFAMLPMVAHTAGEFGDEEVRRKALEKLEKEIDSTVKDSGAVCWNQTKMSFSCQTGTIKAMLLRHGDWKRLVSEGPSKTTLRGPILDQVPYPGVLVAKARSVTSTDLQLVLYPSAKPGNFRLGVSRLQPNSSYRCSGLQNTFKADKEGKASFEVAIDGRTQVHIVPELVG